MRKITLFLSVLFMAIVVKAQRELVSSWDFAALATVSGTDLTPMTYSDETVKVGGTASNLGTGDFEGLAMQGAGSFQLRTKNPGLENRNSGGRKVGVLDLSNEQIVTIVTDGACLTLADANVAIESSVTTENGKTTYVYIMTSDGMLALTMTRNYRLFSIMVENPDPNAADIPVTGISLDKNTAEITEGMIVNLLTATVTPADATDKTVTWTSSDEDIATVNHGQVTGIAVGTTIITAEANGFTATCEVTVNEKMVKTSWDFATLYDTYGSWANMTYAVNTVKVGGTDSNYGIGEYEGLAVQGADNWRLFNKNGLSGLYNNNSGARKIGVLNLKEGQIVTVVADTETELILADANTATQVSVETTDGKSTYSYIMIADGTLALNLTRYYTLVSIKVEDARELVVEDGKDLDATGTYTSATYKRLFNTEYNYGTICLPFAPDAATCENYTFYKLTEVNSEVMYFEEEAEPKANVAYLYKLNDGVDAEDAKTFTGGVTTISDVEVESVGGWNFIGSFAKTKIEDLTDGLYYAYTPTADKDILTKATNSLTVHPYRAYFKFVQGETLNFAPTNVTMRIVFGGQSGEAQGIEKVIAPEEIEGAVFDLEGRPVENMQKGQIYIIGGKKVMK